MGRNNARRTFAPSFDPIHQCGPAAFQPLAYLPSRRRPDPSIAALVRDGTRLQLDGDHDSWLRWRHRIRTRGRENPIRLVRGFVGVRDDVLLERIQTRPRALSAREGAAK